MQQLYSVFYVNELHVKNEDTVWWNDGWETLGTVCILGLTRNHSLFAQTHREDTFIPAPDDHAFANSELQRLAPVVAAVELPPVRELARVMDVHQISDLGLWPIRFVRDLFGESLRSTRNSETCPERTSLRACRPRQERICTLNNLHHTHRHDI